MKLHFIVPNNETLCVTIHSYYSSYGATVSRLMGALGLPLDSIKCYDKFTS